MKRMLINATQAEERRLAIVDGQKLLDYEIEIEGREQRKGNIYKAVVTRVEPSLEACFVDYGEDRHGFLPFKEISRNFFREGADVKNARIQDAVKEGARYYAKLRKMGLGAWNVFFTLYGTDKQIAPNLEIVTEAFSKSGGKVIPGIHDGSQVNELSLSSFSLLNWVECTL
mgnify:CR=1 FL=1